MSIITDTNKRRDPANDIRVIIPNIDIAPQSIPGPSLGALPDVARPQDGGATAQELADAGVSPSITVGDTTPTLMPSSGFDATVANAEQNLRAEFNWRRNAYTNMAPAPLFDSAMATPWSLQAPILNSQLQSSAAPATDRSALSERLASITGINLVTGARSNAFTQSNTINRNRDGRQEDRLADVMRDLGFRNDNWFTRGLANVAGVGGAIINLVESVEDVTTGWAFDNTLGRAIYGTPQASSLRRELSRETNYLAPARALGEYFMTPNADPDSMFGVYGSGLPGAINMVADYVPNLLSGTGLSVWRAGRTVEHALRGEEYGYQWDAPMWNALNPMTSNEVYSFFEDPNYSPLSVRRFIPPELGADATAAERFARRTAVISLSALGFLLDGARPDIDSITDIGRWAARSSVRGGGAARPMTDIVPFRYPDPAPRQATLHPGATQNFLPGYTVIIPPAPNVIITPPPTRPEDVIITRAPGPIITPPPAPGGPLATRPNMSIAGIADNTNVLGRIEAEMSDGTLTGNYETVFVTPDGMVVQVPRHYLPSVEEMRALPPTEFAISPFAARQLPDGAPDRSRLEGTPDRPRLEPAPDQPPTRPTDDALDNTAPDAPDNTAPDAPDAPISPAAPRTADDAVNPSATIEETLQAPIEARLAPVEELPPVRQAGVAETVVTQSIRQGDVVARAEALVRSDDALLETKKKLVAANLELGAISNVPQDFRTRAERARFDELTSEVARLRREINLRPEGAVTPVRPVIDDALPIVPQTTLTPPANPAELYQWSRDLPPGQRIYYDAADYESRSNKALTELARFFGHADVPRNRTLTSAQISKLRDVHGALYSRVGPPIDRSALRRLNVEGVGRVETRVADEVLGTAQESRVVSNPTTRRLDDVNKTADDFGSPRSFTASQLSQLGDDEIARLLDNEFSQKSVYAKGKRDPQLARTRTELLDELSFRQGGSVSDGLTPDDGEIADYLKSMGEPDLNTSALDDAAYAELGERAAVDAERKAAVPVERVRVTLPDDMQPSSLEGDAAIREMIAAEQGVGEAMEPVRELAGMIEELERQLTIDGRKLNGARLPQDLNVGVYDETGSFRTRQMQVDEIADRTAREMQAVTSSKPAAPTETPGYARGEMVMRRERPIVNTPVVSVDGRKGVLTGTTIGENWEVRLPDGSTFDLPQRELFPAGTVISRPPVEAGKVWHVGTRADVPIENYSGLYDGPTHNPMGPGTYLHSDPKVAEDAARSFVGENNIANYPIAQQGRVHSVAPNIENTMDGAAKLTTIPEVWNGMRGLIKEFFADPNDVRNITAAARKKNLVQFYDYLARKLNDDVRLVDFESRVATFLHAQGIDAIHWESPNGSVLNVIKPQALTAGDTARVGGSRALEQFAASTNYDQAMSNMFGTKTAQTVADYSHYRFGMQLRDKLIGHLQDASRHINQALDRLDRADVALEELAARDAKVKARAAAAQAEENFGKYMDNNDADQAKGCL